MIIQSLYVGGRDLQALTLKAYILRMQGKKEEAQETIRYIQQIDPLDYWSAAETNLSVSLGASFLKAGTNHNSKGIIAGGREQLHDNRSHRRCTDLTEQCHFFR